MHITVSLIFIASTLAVCTAQAQFSNSFESSENYTAGGTVAGQPNPASGRNQWIFLDTGALGDLNTLGQVTTPAGSHSIIFSLITVIDEIQLPKD